MIADDFIARLDKHRKAGERSWSARCPAHADKGPSLKVTDVDGKLLIKCFAGCTAAEVVAAMGLNLSDLFPPRDEREAAVYRRERFYKGTLKDMQQEVMVSMLILGEVADGRPLKPADIERAARAKKTLLKLYKEISQAG